ncbi:MAG TPA: HAD-IIA family hydrolase [Acidimicrobiales bacterium]|nr:HAD-IIA family hydrolase [Acidimicrobiales bacterium]
MPWPPDRNGTWVLDLDGVVWLAGEAIDGVPHALAALRRAGIATLFVTNNSSPTVAELVDRLQRAGIAAGPEDVVSSAQAVATMVEKGSTVLALADEGVSEALGPRDVTLVDEGPADVVVVGWTHRFDFDRLAAAATAVRGGARLIGTNEDPTHPTPNGLMPGAGSLLVAVAAAAGVEPVVAGKPHRPMAGLVAGRRSDVRVVVGDRPSTDGVFADRLSVPFALVLSGVTEAGGPPPEPRPDVIAADLAELVDRFLCSPDAIDER